MAASKPRRAVRCMRARYERTVEPVIVTTSPTKNVPGSDKAFFRRRDRAEVSSTDELWKRPIHLMTAIRAKGKEFDTVILLDVNDEIWPNRNAKTPPEKEAERRVFYVAFTRARKRILMFVSDNYRNRKAVPSPFIDELDLPIG